MMNERIRELIHQTNEWMEINAQGDMWEREQKFAELIIRECTNMLPTDSIRNEEGVHIFYVIRDHFGVSPYEGVR
jgi:hypothetical protein